MRRRCGGIHTKGGSFTEGWARRRGSVRSSYDVSSFAAGYARSLECRLRHIDALFCLLATDGLHSHTSTYTVAAAERRDAAIGPAQRRSAESGILQRKGGEARIGLSLAGFQSSIKQDCRVQKLGDSWRWPRRGRYARGTFRRFRLGAALWVSEASGSRAEGKVCTCKGKDAGSFRYDECSGRGIHLAEGRQSAKARKALTVHLLVVGKLP